jgi:SPP1 gp7 family putative phage head morphogenesis protein
MEDKRANLQTASNVFALTTNEKREMIGLDPIKGGDEILIPFSLTELGAKPEVTNTEVKKKFIHPLTNKAFRDSYRLKVDKTMTQYEKRVQKEVRKLFKDQEDRLLKNMGITKGLFDEIFNPSLEASLFKAGLLPIIRDIFMEQGQDTMDTFELGKFNFTSAMETSLQKRADMFSESIINTQSERLQKEFNQSIENQEPREKLVERISNLYQEISEAKAEMIARTEVHSAMQDSNFEAYKQGGLNIKIWVAVGDERTREEHLSLDGEERPINMPFSNGLMYPNEPNCRCSI